MELFFLKHSTTILVGYLANCILLFVQIIDLFVYDHLIEFVTFLFYVEIETTILKIVKLLF